jgi:hypothetical protein
MSKLAIFKKAVSITVGLGVSTIVNQIIANNVSIEKPHQKVTVPLASIAIGGVVADASSDWTDALIDEAAELWTTEIAPRFRK